MAKNICYRKSGSVTFFYILFPITMEKIKKNSCAVSETSGLRPSPNIPVKMENDHFSSGFLRRKMKSGGKTVDSIRKGIFVYFPNLKSVFPEHFYFLRYSTKRKGLFGAKMTKKWPFFDKSTPLLIMQCS